VDVSADAAALFTAVLLYCVKIAGIAVVIAFLEVSVAKMRLFRVMDYFGFSIVLAVLAVISALMGI
jgi:formate hydrogenlyase subunit 4